jgi:hypothetical protein
MPEREKIVALTLLESIAGSLRATSAATGGIRVASGACLVCETALITPRALP